jgi:5-methyltetrahydrofolate--homocysteine methyltransferase
MSELLEKLSNCVESGKINKVSPFPPSMKGLDGADELAKQAIEEGVNPGDVLSKGLVPGMERIGKKFRENKVFVPEVLMAAKAMSAAMNHLKPFFLSGDVKRKGTMIIGTVHGDLHDIGKNLVAMMVEGAGWEVIDLGVDVGPDKFLDVLSNNPSCTVGLSALLTTTMINMENTVKEIKTKYPDTKVLIGGAPLTQQFCDKINADFYSPDPQGAVEYLNAL